MSDDQVFLKSLALVLRNYNVTEFTKSCCDSINDLLFRNKVINHFS